MKGAEGAKDIKLLLNWRVGALAQDWEVLAKKEHIDHISIELQKYEDLVKEMRQEMLHMKKVDKVALATRGPFVCRPPPHAPSIPLANTPKPHTPWNDAHR